MIRLTCPLQRCAVREFPDDTDRVVLATAMSDHLAKDGFFGDSLVSRLADVRVTCEPGAPIDLLSRIDRPLLAEDRAGRWHAIQPGVVSADGRGPAVCSSTNTVKVVLSVNGQPLRAIARKEPGTMQPQCTTCPQPALTAPTEG